MELYILIGALGIVSGFLSGLLGIGGGIVMAPLLLYIPPLLGLEALSMKVVAGLTIVQGLVACVSGGLTHKKFHFLSLKLTLWMGITIFITALAGGYLSGYVSNSILLSVFALLAFTAAFLIFIPTHKDGEAPDINELTFSRARAVAAAGAVGILGGLVGQGGSFILIPLMTSFLHIPTRIAIGSNLAIVFLSSFAAFLGKAATGQIVWSLALPIVVTVIPAGHLGALMSQRVPVRKLRLILAFCIAIAGARVFLSVLSAQ